MVKKTVKRKDIIKRLNTKKVKLSALTIALVALAAVITQMGGNPDAAVQIGIEAEKCFSNTTVTCVENVTAGVKNLTG